MEVQHRYPKPTVLEADPNSTNADKKFLHWKRAFLNYLDRLFKDDTGEADAQEVAKLEYLTTFLDYKCFDYIADATKCKEAMEILQNLFVKPKNEIFARHSLTVRKQKLGESIDEFLQALRTLAKDCNYVAVTAEQYRDESIRNAFISGLSSPAIRQRLLENTTLQLQAAYDQARALDIAQKNSESYAPNRSSIPEVTSEAAAVPQPNCGGEENDDILVDSLAAASIPYRKLEKNSPKSKQQLCKYCGNNRHMSRSECPAKDVSCLKCNRLGHFARVCLSKRNNNRSNDSTSAGVYLASMEAQKKKFRVSAEVIINGSQRANALIDSGSTEKSFISGKLVSLLGLSVKPEKSDVRMAAGEIALPVLGYCTIDLKLQERHYPDVRVSVLQDLCTDLILGTDFQSRHSKLIIDYGGPESPVTFCALTAMKVEPPKLFEHLSPNCKPIRTKSRRHGVQNRLFMEKEVRRMLAEGIIEPSTSSWRAQALVSRDGVKPRMVIDYSQTINRYTLPDAYPLPRVDEVVNNIAKFRVMSTLDLRSAYHQVALHPDDKLYTAFEVGGKLYQFCRIPFGVTNGVPCFQRTIDNIIESNQLEGCEAYMDNVTVGGNDQEEHDHNLSRFLEVAKKYSLTFNEKGTLSATTIKALGYEISNGLLKPDPDRLKPLLELPVPHNIASLRRIIGLFAYYAKWISNFSEKIRPLNKTKCFPISNEAIKSFEALKKELSEVAMQPIDENKSFEVDTDANDNTIAAILMQEGKPVAFYSRTLQGCELKRHSVEKEAQAVVEAVTDKWRYLLLGRHFTIRTDQRSVSFMFSQQKHGKIRNERILRWRMELANFSYDIVYKPGAQNVGPDTFTRVYCSSISPESLKDLHATLGHPGITRMMHFVRSKNLAYSLEDVKQVCSSCPSCARCKPRFHKFKGTLIKATQPFERLNLDFKGPLETDRKNKYILTIIDEFSRFPFAYPVSEITTETVIRCLDNLFSMFGMPSYTHSDRGPSFMSVKLKQHLHSLGIATSRTTPYNPQGNGQCERYNGIIWRTVKLILDSEGLPTSCWESVLPRALHAVRSLLCTATNQTPHERFFRHQRRSAKGSSMPSWLLQPGKILMKKNVRRSKNDALVEEVDLLEANSEYAYIRHPDGRETTVSTRQLAPSGENPSAPVDTDAVESVNDNQLDADRENEEKLGKSGELVNEPLSSESSVIDDAQQSSEPPGWRPKRSRRAPKKLTYDENGQVP